MTTYILFGGAIRNMTDAQNQNLRDAILERLNSENPRIADVTFAEPREVWEQKFRDKHTPTFQRLFGENYQARLVMPDSFLDDVKWANVVYLHGGDATFLAYYLDKFKDLAEIFTGKVVIGTSAGALYLSAIAWNADWREVKPGRGLVNVAVIPHFNGQFGKDDPRGSIDWAAAKRELSSATSLPIYEIPECEFEVFMEGKRS